MYKVGQNRTCTPYMTVHLVISLPKIPYIHHTYDRTFGHFPDKQLPCVYIHMYDSGKPSDVLQYLTHVCMDPPGACSGMVPSLNGGCHSQQLLTAREERGA